MLDHKPLFPVIVAIAAMTVFQTLWLSRVFTAPLMFWIAVLGGQILPIVALSRAPIQQNGLVGGAVMLLYVSMGSLLMQFTAHVR